MPVCFLFISGMFKFTVPFHLIYLKTENICIKDRFKINSQCGQGMKSVKGTRNNCSYLVVIQGEQSDRTQASKTIIAHTANAIAPQHSVKKA